MKFRNRKNPALPLAASVRSLLGALGALSLVVGSADPAWAADAKPVTSVKISGRMAAGYIDGGDDSPSSLAPVEGSVKIPDAKLRFDVSVHDNIVFTMRGSFNNATFNNLDYFYLDYLFTLGDNPSRLRVGRHKFQIGDETFTDNLVESPLVFNSAGIASGYDEGIEFWTKLNPNAKSPVEFVLDAMSGNKSKSGEPTASDDNKSAKAFLARLQSQITENVYLSGSYMTTGDLGTSDAELGIGGLSKAPASSTNWSRKIWMLSARYDVKPGKKRNPPSLSNSKGIIRVIYGQFNDDATPSSLSRDGTTWLVDALWNASENVFLSARESNVSLNDGVTASFNGTATDDYTRTQIAIGYRINPNTNFRIEYQINDSAAPGGKSVDPDDNVLAAVFTTII